MVHIFQGNIFSFFHTDNTNQSIFTKKKSFHSFIQATQTSALLQKSLHFILSFFIRTGNTNQCLFSKKRNYLQTVFQNGNRASTREYKFNFEINNIGLKLCVL